MCARYASSTMENSSALGTLGKRVLAWIVIAVAAIIALKLVVGAVLGFVMLIVTIALIVAVGMAVLWALRHL
jgi:hypothetical protein